MKKQILIIFLIALSIIACNRISNKNNVDKTIVFSDSTLLTNNQNDFDSILQTDCVRGVAEL